MLFNSAEFIFGFLPLTLAVFFLLGLRSRPLALGWLTLASLFFYAWWRPLNVLIIAPSIVVNYGLARLLLKQAAAGEARQRAARWTLVAGIVFNLCFLGWFKYVNFLATIAHDLTGADFVMAEVVLPLGISFITFQKIAFLVDVHGRRVQQFTLGSYALFVLFFPQLIAGPIVHYREMMPQFEAATCRFDRERFAVGATLFVFGLFKKIVMADGISVHVSPLFDAAAHGTPMSLATSWIAALGFTLQLYFDFSGYTDMALGLAQMFGVRLPPNFDSPLKARNIIDFWLRWHMTLTRFLTAYLYNPLVLALTRRRAAQGKPAMVGRATKPGAFLTLLAGPTLLTMLVSGIWHGAGYLFVLWGLLHGVMLSINHAWRIYGSRLFGERAVALSRGWPGALLTFLCVVVAMVLFRSANGTAARSLLQGLAGLHGLGVPEAVFGPLAALGAATGGWVHATAEMGAADMAGAVARIAALLAVALLLPNTGQLMDRFKPTLAAARAPAAGGRRWRLPSWAPTPAWAAAVGTLACLAVWRIGGQGEFLYWQF